MLNNSEENKQQRREKKKASLVKEKVDYSMKARLFPVELKDSVHALQKHYEIRPKDAG